MMGWKQAVSIAVIAVASVVIVKFALKKFGVEDWL